MAQQPGSYASVGNASTGYEAEDQKQSGQQPQAQYGKAEAPLQVQTLGGATLNQDQVNEQMVYQIHGRPAFTYGEITLAGGRQALVDGHGMLWMDAHLQMDTECYGGCVASCLRQCSGEPCCMNMYKGDGQVTVGFEQPGDMLAFGVTRGNGWLLTRCAFVAGTPNLKVSAQFSGCGACCCSDEGMFLTKCEIDEEQGGDAGVFLAGSYGMLERHFVPEGKTMFVGSGNFFASHSTTELEVGMVGGIMNWCCGAGWKSIVLKFTGPATVYTQSRNPQDLRRLQEIAKMSQGNKGGGGDNGNGAEAAEM